jgi:hypothetical protein
MCEHLIGDEPADEKQHSSTVVGNYEIANSVLDAAGFNPFRRCIVLPVARFVLTADGWEEFV